MFQAHSATVTAVSDTFAQRRRLPLDAWLPGVRAAAEHTHDRSTRLKSWSTLLGLDCLPGDPGEGNTVVEMPLSTQATVGVPKLGPDGVWRLPEPEGNGGEYEHLFVKLTREVVVRVA